MKHPRITRAPALILLSALVLLSGCSASSVLSRRGNPDYAPPTPVTPPPILDHNGSIYAGSYPRPLFEDIKARQIGDLLTVILSEQTDASKKASTGVTKGSTTDVASATVLGRTVRLGGEPLTTGLDSSHEFSGESDSAQSNRLQGNITVTVSQVLPNGNLLVQGEKWIAINQGDEYVRLRGIVRPVDIQPDNSIESTKIADARIIYRGKGAPADANSMGWLSRFFIHPVFPY